MSSANETAEAFLIVLKKILKWIFFGAIILVSVLFVGIKLEELWKWQTNGKHAEKVTIQFVTFINENRCSKDYPYMYVISNKSSKIVEKTMFDVKVRRVGYSNVINEYTIISDSKILKPTETTMSCFRAVSLDNKREILKDTDVNFSVGFKSVEFSK